MSARCGFIAYVLYSENLFSVEMAILCSDGTFIRRNLFCVEMRCHASAVESNTVCNATRVYDTIVSYRSGRTAVVTDDHWQLLHCVQGTGPPMYCPVNSPGRSGGLASVPTSFIGETTRYLLQVPWRRVPIISLLPANPCLHISRPSVGKFRRLHGCSTNHLPWLWITVPATMDYAHNALAATTVKYNYCWCKCVG